MDKKESMEMLKQVELAIKNYEIAEKQYDFIFKKSREIIGEKIQGDAAETLALSLDSVKGRLEFMNSLPTPEREIAVCNFLFGRIYGNNEALFKMLGDKKILDDFFYQLKEENKKRREDL